ncbi:MAG: recombinase RecT [Pyrinomonadaceae bacterium]
MPNITKSEAPKADVWNKPANPETLRSLLSSPSALERIGKVIPKHLTPDRMLNISLSIINAPAKGSLRLLDATPLSLLQAIINLAEIGLEPGGVKGHAAIIPFKDPKGNRTLARAQPMYQGLIELALRSGKYKKVEARVVFEKDKFELRYGINETLNHEPSREDDPGRAVLVWAMATLRDGERQFGHMSRAEVYKIRDRSESYRSAIKYNKTDTPWIRDELEMWRKTAVKRESKYWSKSEELEKAIALDNEDESEPMLDMNTRPFEVIDGKVEAPPPPAPEPEDAETVDPDTGEVTGGGPPAAEEKMQPPEGDDPVSGLLRGVLTAKDRDTLDERIAEAGRERKNMSDEEWSDVQRVIAQRKTELQ